jgi:hypothetical protein
MIDARRRPSASNSLSSGAAQGRDLFGRKNGFHFAGYEGETALVTNDVLEVMGRHPRTLPVSANDHAADRVK